MNDFKFLMDVATGKEVADLAICNARLVNVYTGRIEDANVLVAGGLIARVSSPKENFTARQIIDAQGMYLVPGFIDAHTHFELAMMSAVPFAEAVLPRGTTAAVVDPHDLANVMGIEGLRLLAEEIKLIPLKTYLMIPPCVPSAPKLEDAGATMTLQDIKLGLKLPYAHGIAETMDFNRVLDQEPELMAILSWAREEGILVDGHCPELRGKELQAYTSTGPILTDHESVTVEEMREKYQAGMRVIIRRGSLSEPASAGEFVNSLANTGNVLLATDGCITIGDMLDKGHMDNALRAVVAEGVDPITAVQMATINVARAYRLDHKLGGIAPGRSADMVLLSDLQDFQVQTVIVNGKKLEKDLHLPRFAYPDAALQTIKLSPVAEDTFHIKAPCAQGKAKVRVINIIDGTLATTEEHHELPVKGGLLCNDPKRDLLKVAVFERYGKTGTYAVGIIKGTGIKNGAVGGSVGQDTQNVVVVGTSDADMALAVNTLREQQGGLVVVGDGCVLASVRLPIAGIMTDIPPAQLKQEVAKFDAASASLGCTLTNPFLTLSLQIALAVIPELRITNRGLVDVLSGKFVPLFVD